MRIPSENELLGMQTSFDAEILRKAYPEYFSIPPEDRPGYLARQQRYHRQSMIELILVLLICLVVSITFGTALFGGLI